MYEVNLMYFYDDCCGHLTKCQIQLFVSLKFFSYFYGSPILLLLMGTTIVLLVH